jgi:hypothetical protein
MTTYYSIDSANGNQITTGISEHLARRTAQQLADRRNETVTLYSDDDSEEIEPTEIEVELDSPNGPRVRYGAQDAETVEAEIPEGWEVDWSSAINLAPTGTHRIRYSAPLVSDGTVEAMIAERDGWPDAGDYVLVGDDVYQIVTIADTIHTGVTGSSAPNYVYARIRLADWDDLPDGQEPAWSAGIVTE